MHFVLNCEPRFSPPEFLHVNKKLRSFLFSFKHFLFFRLCFEAELRTVQSEKKLILGLFYKIVCPLDTYFQLRTRADIIPVRS